jgi:formylglycine-generating enzyme required for sulfatase activity
MVLVPACMVISAYGGEYPIEAFAIDRLPVTNERYLAFVKATGAPAPAHWRKGAPPQERLRHPVVGVTLDEARRFAAWEGRRLPTCVEWEAAARSPDGRIFPWGDEWDPRCCHGPERSGGDTTAVDRHPQGASPVGCLDLVGNVWEWTELDPRLSAQEPGTTWVLGGSYAHPCAKGEAIARSAVSLRKSYLYLGFRCALGDEEPAR